MEVNRKWLEVQRLYAEKNSSTFIPLVNQSQEKEPVKAISVTVNLSPNARAVVDATRDEFGTSNVEVVTRIMTWFASQPDRVRSEIIRVGGDAAGELARLKLAELAAAGKGEDRLTFEQLGDAAQVAITQLIAMGKNYRALAADKGGKKKG